MVVLVPTEVQVSLRLGLILVLTVSQCSPVHMPTLLCQAVIGLTFCPFLLWPLESALLSNRAKIPRVRAHLLSYLWSWQIECPFKVIS